MLILEGASLRYGDTVALHPCTLTFRSGEEAVIVGHSGSGKSSLLKVASGLVDTTTGSINSGDHSISGMSEHQRSKYRAGNVGFVYQDYNLIEHLTVLQNVQLAWNLRQHHTTPLEAINAVGLGHRITHRPAELSGGEQQRVSIARAVCGGPSILFADEPTGALDDETTAIIVEMLRRMRSEFGLLLIVVTHDQTLANTFERKISLDQGSVVADVSQ